MTTTDLNPKISVDEAEGFYTDVYTPDSSFIERVMYDAPTTTIWVVISSVAYGYSGFDPLVWTKFVTAPSLGTFYHDNIQSEYGASRIENVEDLMWRGYVPVEHDERWTPDTWSSVLPDSDVTLSVTQSDEAEEAVTTENVMADYDWKADRFSRVEALQLAIKSLDKQGLLPYTSHQITERADVFLNWIVDGSV